MRVGSVKRKLILSVILLTLVITGCSAAAKTTQDDRDVLTIRKDGGIEVTLSAVFDQPYYSEDELVGSVEEELNAYNNDIGEERIRILEHHTEGGKAYLTLLFTDYRDCAEYLSIDFFNGTVQGAYDEGFDLSQALYSRSDPDTVIGKNNLREMAESHIVICGEDYLIICPNPIDYYSYGMELISKNEAARIPEDPEHKEHTAAVSVLIY